jgi:hypothetical protein
MVLRIWPLLDPERPTEAVMPGRTSPYDTAGLQGMALSELVPVVSYAGITEKIAGHLRIRPAKQYDPCSYIIAKSTSETVEGVDYNMLPYPLIQNAYRAVEKSADYGSAKDGQFDAKWIGLFPRKNAPRELALPGVKNVSFAVCSLLENGEEFNLQSQKVKVFTDGKESSKLLSREGVPLGERGDDPLVVVELSASAARAIWKICNVPNEDYQGDAEYEPAKAFKYGDPTGIFDPESGGLSGGLFFTVYNPEYETIDSHTTAAPKPKKGKGRDKSDGFGSYECAVRRGYKFRNYTLSASRTASQLDHILDRQVFLWPNGDEAPGDRSYLLQVPTVEEQALLLAKALKPFPQAAALLRYCWSPAPEYLRFDSVRGLLANRTSTVLDGGRDVVEAEPDEQPRRSRQREADPARDPRRELQRNRNVSRDARRDSESGLEDDGHEFFAAELDEEPVAPPRGKRPAAARSTGDEFDDQFDEDSADEFDEDSDEDSADEFDEFDEDSADEFDEDSDEDSADEFDEDSDEDSADEFDEDSDEDSADSADEFESPAAKSMDFDDDQAQIMSELDVDFEEVGAGDFDLTDEEESAEPPTRTASESAAIKRSRK